MTWRLEQDKYVNKKCKKKTNFGLNFKKNLCILNLDLQDIKPFQ